MTDALFGPDGVIPDYTGGRVRNPDRRTSIAGANAVAFRAGSQKARLLAVYAAHPEGLTDEEAATHAGLLAACYWKRCGELRGDSLIQDHPAGLARPGAAGVPRLVAQITTAGVDKLAALRWTPS